MSMQHNYKSCEDFRMSMGITAIKRDDNALHNGHAAFSDSKHAYDTVGKRSNVLREMLLSSMGYMHQY